MSYQYYPSDWELGFMKSNHVQISALGFLTSYIATTLRLPIIRLLMRSCTKSYVRLTSYIT